MIALVAAVLVAVGFVVFVSGTYLVLFGTYPDLPEQPVKDND